MKVFIAFLGGFGLTLISFGGGIALAITYFAAEPVHRPGPAVDTAATWPSQPVKVTGNAGLQRVEPAQPAPSRRDETAARDDAGQEEIEDAELIEVDAVTTASVAPGETAADKPDPHRVTINDAHVAWCRERYRSYRAEDNSYQPYGRRGREACASPFFGGEGSSQFAAGGGSAEAELVAEYHAEPAIAGGAVQMTRDHIRMCFDRYRSYRPEDNSYQPYGGGPRQQCM